MKIDIYGQDRQFERVLKKLEKANISKHNKELIIRFKNNCIIEGISKARIQRYLYDLIKLGVYFGKKKFEDATREDIERVINEFISSGNSLNGKPYSPRTIEDFKKSLKRFFKWLRGTDHMPPEVAWLKGNGKATRVKTPEEVLTQEEIRKMISVADNKLERAFVSMLYESGCRIGEIANIRLKDIEFLGDHVLITVNGKTGVRRIVIVFSLPYLQEWINEHPLKDNPEAPLWINKHMEPMRYKSFADILKDLAKKAGIKKKVNPHNFRHSRATHLAGKLPEAVMKEFFGWTQSSKMAGIYVHLSGEAVRKEVLRRVYGLEKVEEEKREELSPIICPRCKEQNPPTHKFCCKCGMILDEEEARKLIETESKKREAERILELILTMRREKFKELVKECLVELGEVNVRT